MNWRCIVANYLCIFSFCPLIFQVLGHTHCVKMWHHNSHVDFGLVVTLPKQIQAGSDIVGHTQSSPRLPPLRRLSIVHPFLICSVFYFYWIFLVWFRRISPICLYISKTADSKNLDKTICPIIFLKMLFCVVLSMHTHSKKMQRIKTHEKWRNWKLWWLCLLINK